MSDGNPFIARTPHALAAAGVLKGLGNADKRLPKGTTDVVMQRLFPSKRAEVDYSEERKERVYDYLALYGCLPEHFLHNPGEFDPRIKWNGHIPHAPAEKQHSFLWLPNRHAMYGGQAGGGKSDGILMAALQYVDIPEYAALIIRQSFPDLKQPGAIMSRAKEWLLGQPGVKWNENDRQFTFQSGAKLVFGFLKRDDDVQQYRSAEFQFIGFDELTQFSEYQYTYMESRLRRLKGMDVPLRMRSATNPGGKGHQWVRRMFVDEHKDKEYAFIPASIADNLHLDQREYIISLEHLDPYTRAQYLHGDWNARPPGNWAFDHAHLDAVFRLGSQWYEEYKAHPIPPVGGIVHAGMDYGEAAHILAIWPREQMSIWVPFEHPFARGEPDREAQVWLKKFDRFMAPIRPVRMGRSRFDSSKPESMRLFYRTLRNERDPEYGKPSPIAFNKWKRAAILQVRGMASRTAWGESAGRLGISGILCPVLQDQLYGLKFKGEDTEDLVKEDDHGPDALFAGIAPEIKKWNEPAENPPQNPDKDAQEIEEFSKTLSSG